LVANDPILPRLRALPLDYVDPQTIEKVFAVSRSEAYRILRNLDTLGLTGLLLVRRDALIQWIEAFVQSAEAQCEIRRVERIDQLLETIRRNAAGIRVPAADVRSRLLRDLPGGIELQPGELRVSFSEPRISLLSFLKVFPGHGQWLAKLRGGRGRSAVEVGVRYLGFALQAPFGLQEQLG
jgi:hypothetical protein